MLLGRYFKINNLDQTGYFKLAVVTGGVFFILPQEKKRSYISLNYFFLFFISENEPNFNLHSSTFMSEIFLWPPWTKTNLHWQQSN